MNMDLLAAIEAILPQTQCTQCGFNACKPYAQALARQEAPINLCPPGGIKGIEALASLLKQPFVNFPSEPPLPPKALAFIDENNCIGCTHCIRACPVDAIIGSAKKMHTILSGHCTGCALCLPACPVDCIEMRPLTREEQTEEDRLDRAQQQQRALQYKTRYEHKQNRAKKQMVKAKIRPSNTITTPINTPATTDLLAQILAKAAQKQPTEQQNQAYQQQQQDKIKQGINKATKRQKRACYAKLNKPE